MRNEIRYAFRTLLRDRGFALMVVLSLAVGIGANTAIFSLVNGVLLRPPDFPHPEQLVALTQFAPKLAKDYPALPVSIAIFAEWRKQLSSMEGMGLHGRPYSISRAAAPEQLRGMVLSAVCSASSSAAASGTSVRGGGRSGRARADRDHRRFIVAPPLPG